MQKQKSQVKGLQTVSAYFGESFQPFQRFMKDACPCMTRPKSHAATANADKTALNVTDTERLINLNLRNLLKSKREYA